MKLGACTSLDYYDTLAENGYQTIALPAREVASWDEETLENARRKLEAGPLERISLNTFCPGELRLNGPDYRPEAVRAYSEKLMKNAAYLGYKMIGIGSPQSRNIADGADYQRACDETREAVEIVCDAAAEQGIDILMESVCSIECNLITTTREMLEFIRKIDRKNLHLVYDIYHEYVEHQPVSVIDEAGDEIRVVHIAQLKDNKRYYLDEEHISEYKEYWNRLVGIGYKGEWNLECFEGDPSVEFRKSMEIMQKVRG